MITKVFADKDPLVLNFEDPEDMIRKQQLLQQAATGQLPEAPTGTAGQQTAQPAQSAQRTDVVPNVPR
jgi:hypothetical protein